MPFNSFSYILLFLPVSILLTVLARKLGGWRAAQGTILACSIFFYGFGRPANLIYLFASILVNWQFGKWLGTTEGDRQKRLLQLALVLNVVFLGVFKYVNFFIRGVPYLVRHGIILPDLEFPLGISFFTITQIMYLVNCYEGAIDPSSLFDHATFVSFFPYVISGPISRAKRIIHQFPNLGGRKGESSPEIARGLFLFAIGLFKKVVFADAFGEAASYGFHAAGRLSMVEAWLFATCYAMQIYFDFSGYSDMAIGSALMLDIQLPPNFDKPFRSLSIIEYWQRWHITLTGFITNYLYTPMIRAFKKRTWVVTSGATLLAMAIAGLWHGPNWTFVTFGAIHGVALAVNQNWRTFKMPKLPPFLSWLITMIVVDVGFIYFEAPSMAAANAYLPHFIDVANLFDLHTARLMNGDGLRGYISGAVEIVGLGAALLGMSSEARARIFKPTWLTAFATAGLAACAMVFLNSNIAQPFIYFAF